VHDVAAYKETRQVVDRCIMEVALHEPKVKEFVVRCPPDLRFERATPELLQLVVMHLLPEGKEPPLSRPVLAARLEVSDEAMQSPHGFVCGQHSEHARDIPQRKARRWSFGGALGSARASVP
jgi:hypothetical protein